MGCFPRRCERLGHGPPTPHAGQVRDRVPLGLADMGHMMTADFGIATGAMELLRLNRLRQRASAVRLQAMEIETRAEAIEG